MSLVKEYSWSKSHFYFVDKPCEKRNLGYPLDSMSIMTDELRHASKYNFLIQNAK